MKPAILPPLLLLLLAASAACADLTVTKVWARASTPGAEAGAIFALITGGEATDRLIAVESPAAKVVELHEHAKGADGVLTMRRVDGGVAIPAHGTVELKPGGYHIMLIGLAAPIAGPATVPVTFVFEHAGRIPVTAEVLAPWAMSADERD